MEDLSNCVDSIESKFYMYEECNADVSLTVKNKDESTSSIDFPIPNTSAKQLLQPLFDNAVVSPFGVGSETVVDKSVRNAMHLLPEQFECTFDPQKEGILEKIRGILVPEASEVTATLLKMNIYTKGGHFKMHKDTPRGENCFGSLVVCLPCGFRGGNLELHHATEDKIIDLSNGFRPRYISYGKSFETENFTPKKQVKWVAFFGDVDHEVNEVTDGTRITLS